MLALRGQARLIIQLVATAGIIIADAAPVLKMAEYAKEAPQFAAKVMLGSAERLPFRIWANGPS
jgi:hypothetical protein